MYMCTLRQLLVVVNVPSVQPLNKLAGHDDDNMENAILILHESCYKFYSNKSLSVSYLNSKLIQIKPLCLCTTCRTGLDRAWISSIPKKARKMVKATDSLKSLGCATAEWISYNWFLHGVFHSTHFLSLSKPGAHITHNAKISGCNAEPLASSRDEELS